MIECGNPECSYRATKKTRDGLPVCRGCYDRMRRRGTFERERAERVVPFDYTCVGCGKEQAKQRGFNYGEGFACIPCSRRYSKHGTFDPVRAANKYVKVTDFECSGCGEHIAAGKAIPEIDAKACDGCFMRWQRKGTFERARRRPERLTGWTKCVGCSRTYLMRRTEPTDKGRACGGCACIDRTAGTFDRVNRARPGEVPAYIGHMLSEDDRPRFVRGVDNQTTHPCFPWPYATTDTGYPVFNVKGAHVAVCEMVNGPKPEPHETEGRYEASHLCGRGHLGCATPSHLVWETQLENNQHKATPGTRPGC